MLVALSAGQKAGLAIAAGVFVAFALFAVFVAPARWPDFPGRQGIRPFVAATAVMFAGMMLAVFFLAREEEGGHDERTQTHQTE